MKRVLVLAVVLLAVFAVSCVIVNAACAQCPYSGKAGAKSGADTGNVSQVPDTSEGEDTDDPIGDRDPLAGGGREHYDSYDDETGLPDVAESDRYGEVE